MYTCLEHGPAAVCDSLEGRLHARENGEITAAAAINNTATTYTAASRHLSRL